MSVVAAVAACSSDSEASRGATTAARDTIGEVEIVRNEPLLDFDSTSIATTELWRSSGTDSEHLRENPRFLARGHGIVAVLDAQAHRVIVLDAESGAELSVFGGEGDGPGEFRRPFGIAVVDSSIVVGNANGPSFEFYSLDGTHRRRVRIGALSFLLEGLSDGRLWIAALEDGKGVNLLVDPDGETTRVAVPDTSVADPEFVVGDCPRWSAVEDGLLRLHCRRMAYQELEFDGDIRREVFLDLPPILATDEELAELEQQLGQMVNQAGLAPDDARQFVEERLEIARVKGVYQRIRSDPVTGHVYVLRQVPGSETSGPASLLVFRDDGTYQGHAAFSRPWRDFRVADGHVFAIEEEPGTGLTEVVAYAAEARGP